MQTQLALGAFDYAAFCYGIQTACDARGVTSVQCPDEARARLSYLEACALYERWRSLAPTQSLQLEFGG